MWAKRPSVWPTSKTRAVGRGLWRDEERPASAPKRISRLPSWFQGEPKETRKADLFTFRAFMCAIPHASGRETVQKIRG